jgi:hypothetical protein
MSDQPPNRPHRQLRNRPTANSPRKWKRATLVVVGTVTVGVGVSAGLVATSGHGTSASLSSDTTAKTNAPLTASSAPSSSAPAAPPSAASRISSPASAASQAGSRSAGSAPWMSTSCPSQMASWRGTGAGGQLQVVVTDLAIVSQAATSLHADPATGTIPPAAVTALRSATASLNASTHAAGKNLIPGCVSSAHQAEVAGLAKLSGAVANFDNAANETGNGKNGTAQSSMQTAVAAMQSGSAEMATAITGVNQYGAK